MRREYIALRPPGILLPHRSYFLTACPFRVVNTGNRCLLCITARIGFMNWYDYIGCWLQVSTSVINTVVAGVLAVIDIISYRCTLLRSEELMEEKHSARREEDGCNFFNRWVSSSFSYGLSPLFLAISPSSPLCSGECSWMSMSTVTSGEKEMDESPKSFR